MKELSIRLTSYQDVQELCAVSTEANFPVAVTDGFRRVNAKSFLCIFTLDLTQPLQLQLDCSDEDLDRFRRMVEKFEVK